MGQEPVTTPDDIRATRADLSRDIDELNEKINPARVLDRRKEAVKSRLGSARDSVMGSSSGAAGSAADTAAGTRDAVVDGASGAVSSLSSRAQGNPLAAGLIAFGAGVLLSSLIPPSKVETRAAGAAVDALKEHGQPLIDEAQAVGQQMGDQLKDAAADSAQQLKESAQESVQKVQQEGAASAQSVKDEATP
ncbi:MAG: hypothetical protein JWO46_2461 [Nocardioidaceae bacterium]|nr:hypothetical protein [Nocardioidaceae bacterium]